MINLSIAEKKAYMYTCCAMGSAAIDTGMTQEEIENGLDEINEITDESVLDKFIEDSIRSSIALFFDNDKYTDKAVREIGSILEDLLDE